MLSGEEGELARLRAVLGETGGGEDAPFYLVGPNGRLRALFTSTQTPEAIADDLITLWQHPHDPVPDANR